MKKYYLILLSLLSGLLLSIAWPANGCTYLIFVALVPLFFMEDYISRNKHAFVGFAGFLYSFPAFLTWNVLTTYWITNSTIGGAIMAMVFNSIFMSTIFQLYFYTKHKLYKGKNAFFTLVIFWLSFEYIHLHWDITWTWLNLGNIFASTPKIIQWYEYTGTFGGSLWVFLSNILAFNIFKKILIKETHSKLFKIQLISLFITICFPVIFSLVVYYNYQDKGIDTEVVVIQPNIDPYNEQFELTPNQSVGRMIKLASTQATPNTQFIVTPESALQEYPWASDIPNTQSAKLIKAYLQTLPKAEFVAGMSTREILPDGVITKATKEHPFEKGLFYENRTSAIMINDKSEEVPISNKSKLVPGVEMMPFAKYLKFMDKLAIDMGGTTGSLGIDSIRNPLYSKKNNLKVGTLICYESIFGEFVSEFVANGAELLFIITNDGWWGNTPGHRQHCKYAVLRAIETRKSIARSANTGISCFVNQRGDISQATPYWEPAAIKATLKANKILTVYVRYGDFIARGASFASVLVLLILLVFRIKTGIENKGKK